MYVLVEVLKYVDTPKFVRMQKVISALFPSELGAYISLELIFEVTISIIVLTGVISSVDSSYNFVVVTVMYFGSTTSVQSGPKNNFCVSNSSRVTVGISYRSFISLRSSLLLPPNDISTASSTNFISYRVTKES